MEFREYNNINEIIADASCARESLLIYDNDTYIMYLITYIRHSCDILKPNDGNNCYRSSSFSIDLKNKIIFYEYSLKGITSIIVNFNLNDPNIISNIRAIKDEVFLNIIVKVLKTVAIDIFINLNLNIIKEEEK
jgi:hypothetical protein